MQKERYQRQINQINANLPNIDGRYEFQGEIAKKNFLSGEECLGLILFTKILLFLPQYFHVKTMQIVITEVFALTKNVFAILDGKSKLIALVSYFKQQRSLSIVFNLQFLPQHSNARMIVIVMIKDLVIPKHLFVIAMKLGLNLKIVQVR